MSRRFASVLVSAGLTVVSVMSLVGCSSHHRTQGTTGNASFPQPAIVTVTTVTVGDPGNHPVAIVPFHPGIYKSCSDAPSRHSGCRLVGAVGYRYEVGELETTVRQYVAFLNTVDPLGRNRRDLYTSTMSPTKWPKYGSIRRLSGSQAAPGRYYEVAYPQWADKPIGFANFLRAASFVNSLTNGKVLSRTTSTAHGFHLTTYQVRLSRNTQDGMYDLALAQGTKAVKRTRSTGFVVPSQNEWIKAAYFDPAGRGSFSYWKFPTGPSKAPHASQLNSNGDIANAGTQPLSTYSPRSSPNSQGTAVPTWCPSQAGSDCESLNPFGLSPTAYQSKYQANLSSVGQTQSRSPWGTLDQGGNAVEWTDTVAPSPLGSKDPRVWRYAHGGVANAPAYQLWISAIGRLPQANVVAARINPWEGFRIGVVGDLHSGN